MRHFLLLLFLGYYGSITFFTHAHIVNGVTIVHSHPYSSGIGKNPIKHQHSSNEYILIQLLAHIITTVIFLALSIEALKVVFRKINFQKKNQNFSDLAFLSSNGLRAPPFKYIC